MPFHCLPCPSIPYGRYGATLAWARSALLLATLVVLSASLCLACGPICFKGLDLETDTYYDKDLL